MVNLLLTIRLAQSILKRKFPSVDKQAPPNISPSKNKPLKNWPLKNMSLGLFSEFYGI